MGKVMTMPKNYGDLGWTKIEGGNEDTFPEVNEDGFSEYILLSFENCSLPVVGRYEVDGDGDGWFFEGDEDNPLIGYGLFVNAWMPLPESYKEDK